MKNFKNVLQIIVLVQALNLPFGFAADKCIEPFQSVNRQAFTSYLPAESRDLRVQFLNEGVARPFANFANSSNYSKASLALISELKLVGSDPSMLMPAEKVVVDDWISNDFYQNLKVSNSIRISHQADETYQTDCCFAAEDGHEKTLVRAAVKDAYMSDQFGDTTFIEIEGIGIIGAVKRVGDPTLIALQNLVNSEGQPVLIRGAIYDVSKMIFQTRLKPLYQSTQKFAVIKLDSISLRPGRFLDPTHLVFSNISQVEEIEAVKDPRAVHKLWWNDFLKQLHQVYLEFKNRET